MPVDANKWKQFQSGFLKATADKQEAKERMKEALKKKQIEVAMIKDADKRIEKKTY